MTTRWNLLEEPLFEVRTEEGSAELDLCGVLAALSRGEDPELVRLRPHQAHAWHAFTVQLAAIALDRSGETTPWTQPEAWRRALLALTDGPEAWCLLVEDLSKPAFMQPPVPEGKLDRFKTVREPDLLDVLQLAKNHDVKRAKLARATTSDWLFALISLQTTDGFGGAGNYGVARMNGGLGSRSDVSVVTAQPRFLREVALWARERARLVSEIGYTSDGPALLWLAPWDGVEALPIESLDPAFIEVCRRVRLVMNDSQLVARTTTSKAARIAQERKGATGDLWTPIRRKDGAGLTMPEGGPTYSRVHEWLFSGNWDPNPTLLAKGDEPVSLLVRGLVRGQGTTDGYHQRVIPIPGGGGIRLRFGEPSFQEKLATLSRERITLVKDFRNKVLKMALLAFLQGGADDLNLKDEGPKPFVQAFERDVDSSYFERLFADVGAKDGAERFEQLLRELGHIQLERCFVGAPVPSARRLRAIARAENLYAGACRDVLPTLAAAEAAERSA